MAAIVGLLVAAGASSTPAQAATEEYVRYYAVESSAENLNSVAQRLLGSSERSTEIFNLNTGRTQPDGGSLSDPSILHAGWYLVLPWDAAGPGVQYGILPKTTPPPKTPTPGVTQGTTGQGPKVVPGAPSSPRVPGTPNPASVPAEPPPPPPPTPGCVAAPPTAAPSNWAMARLDSDQAGRISSGGGQLVAIVDSGVDGRAAQLRGQVAIGVNIMTGEGRGDSDCLGTGTAMAGLIAAKPVGKQTFTGVAPQAIVIPVRVVTDGTTPGKADNAAAIEVAVSAGATVIALGSYVDITDSAVISAMQTAVNHGVVVVACAPTGSTSTMRPPPGVILVGGVAEDGAIAADYTRGFVDVVAPGANVTSVAVNGADAFVGSGTRYAVALTAGAAALVRSSHPDLTAEQVAHRLTVTSDSMAGAQPDSQYGHGMINLVAALTRELPEEATQNPVSDNVGRRTSGSGARVAFLITILVSLVLIVLLVYGFRRSIRHAGTDGGDQPEPSPADDPLDSPHAVGAPRGLDHRER